MKATGTEAAPDVATRLLGAVVPHAGYIYSGAKAAHVYERLSREAVLPETLVIFGPNHTGLGPPVSLFAGEGFETPFGVAAVNVALRDALADRDLLVLDQAAHRSEHSIEVQIPYLQKVYADRGVTFSFVPIVLGDQSDACVEAVCEAVAPVLEKRKERLLFLASSDFSHYVPDAQARKFDLRAIEAVIEGDLDRFYDLIDSGRVSACGFGPIAAVSRLSRRFGARSARLLSYGTSGEVSGDLDRVVGYAGLVFEAPREV